MKETKKEKLSTRKEGRKKVLEQQEKRKNAESKEDKIQRIQQKKEEREKKKRRQKYLYSAIILLSMFALFIGVVKYNEYIQTMNYEDAEFGDIEGKTRNEIQAMLDEKVDESKFEIAINSEPIFFENGAVGNVNIENSPLNRRLMVVELRLKEDDVLLYRTGAIRPGYYIENIELDEWLEAGDYEAEAVFIAQDPDTRDELARIIVDMNIKVLDASTIDGAFAELGKDEMVGTVEGGDVNATEYFGMSDDAIEEAFRLLYGSESISDKRPVVIGNIILLLVIVLLTIYVFMKNSRIIVTVLSLVIAFVSTIIAIWNLELGEMILADERTMVLGVLMLIMCVITYVTYKEEEKIDKALEENEKAIKNGK